jgi:formylglycine-generating enzyme required for sulfatase activity
VQCPGVLFLPVFRTYPHTVYPDDFYIDEYEVTNYQYSICVEEGACRAPERIGETFMTSQYYGDPQFDAYPVDTVNWFMADTYCHWRKARLPTEAEWEKAARGTDGRSYPRGEGINCDYANYRGCAKRPVGVGSYENAKSVYGAYDMAGNVWEWVSTMFQHYP